MNFVFRWAGWSLSRCFFHLSHHISSAHTHTHTLWRPLSTCKVQVSLSYRSVYLTRCLWSHSADLWRCHSAASDYSWRLSALSSRPPVPLGEHAAVLLHQRTVRFPPQETFHSQLAVVYIKVAENPSEWMTCGFVTAWRTGYSRFLANFAGIMPFWAVLLLLLASHSFQNIAANYSWH